MTSLRRFWPVFVLAAFAAWLVTACSRSVPPPVSLPDGSVLTYRGLTYGTNHVSPNIPPMQQRLAHLPAPVQAWITSFLKLKSTPATRRVTSTPTLLLWFELDTRAATSTTKTLSSTSVWLADGQDAAAGEEQRVTYFYLNAGQPPLREVSTSFNVFPRRGAVIRVHVGQRGADNKLQSVTSFDIQNPDRRSTTAWRAEAMPTSKTNGDLQCTLTHIATGYGNNNHYRGTSTGIVLAARAIETGPEKQTELGFEFQQPGMASNVWTTADVRLADATGNDIGQRSLSSTTRDGHVLTLFHPSLWPEESAWRLTLFAKRIREAAFTADELITFTNIALPEPEADRVTGSFPRELHGKTTIALTSVKRRRIPHPVSSNGYERCDFVFVVFGLDRDWYFDLVDATDDNGRPLTQGNSGVSRPAYGPSRFDIGFVNVPTNAKAANLTFVLQRGRRFEFLVRPEFISPDHVPPGATPLKMER